MSMPVLPEPNPDFTQEQALTMILSSIALEEAALSHIMNAEGEKIQYILSRTSCGSADVKDVLAVNKSAADLLELILQNQMILKNKMDKVLEHLPKPPDLPAPPIPPCCANPPSPPVSPCCAPACFDVMPRYYGCHESLLWYENSGSGCFILAAQDCSKIQTPRTGIFGVDFYLEAVDPASDFIRAELSICCGDKKPAGGRLYLYRCGHTDCFHAETELQMPCSCTPCYVSAAVCEPQGLRIRKGRILFTQG